MAVSGMLSTDLAKSEMDETAVAGGCVRTSPKDGDGDFGRGRDDFLGRDLNGFESHGNGAEAAVASGRASSKECDGDSGGPRDGSFDCSSSSLSP